MKNSNGNDILLIGGRTPQNMNQNINKKGRKTMEVTRIDKNAEGNKKLIYKLTSSPEVQKMSTIDDGRIDVTHYCFYTDVKERNGETSTVQVLALMTRQGEIFGTNSATVQAEFTRVLDLFEEDLEVEGGYIPLHIFKGVSKNNRTFLTCAYAD